MQADPMFERFTAYARHVVVLAQEEARRLNHNYIGTEHVLLGLLGEPTGIAFHVLGDHGMTLEGVRQEVTDLIGLGKQEPGKHIPFTPRAKKTLELSLREALQLHHDYIGTEHILLGLIREGDGVAAQIMKKHADLLAIRIAVLDRVSPGKDEAGRRVRWARRATLEFLRRGGAGEAGLVAGQPAEEPSLTATPAADATLSEAARLAGTRPVGSHHLLLAALADTDSAAARALAALGIDLERAREALRDMDVTGTSDEQPEEAGRRQMVVRVHEDRLTIEAGDPVIVAAAQAALVALGEGAVAAGELRGETPACASLAAVWQALRDSLETIKQDAAPPEAA
jgi:ATP-dependent Clp protease ATP-binding subunit ClpA